VKLRWTAEAAESLEQIYSYVSLHHPEFLERTMKEIYSRIQSLRAHHALGRPHPTESGCRILVFTPMPYLCVYRIDMHAVTVLQIRHGARQTAHEIQ